MKTERGWRNPDIPPTIPLAVGPLLVRSRMTYHEPRWHRPRNGSLYQPYWVGPNVGSMPTIYASEPPDVEVKVGRRGYVAWSFWCGQSGFSHRTVEANSAAEAGDVKVCATCEARAVANGAEAFAILLRRPVVYSARRAA